MVDGRTGIRMHTVGRMDACVLCLSVASTRIKVMKETKKNTFYFYLYSFFISILFYSISTLFLFENDFPVGSGHSPPHQRLLVDGRG